MVSIESEKLEKVAEILKSVAHPVRIQVIELLGQYDKLNVSQIVEILNVEQSLTSHHLTKMKDKGVLICNRDGKHVYYSLADTKITSIIECINNCDI